MEYKLTSKYQHSKKGKDGKNKNYLLYFLNDILIFKQKMPFDENYEKGWENRTRISDVYLLNSELHQTRQVIGSDKIRNVKYPISKKLLSQFNIPTGLKISICR